MEKGTFGGLRLKITDRTLTATLIDSEAARDFVSLLPLTLTMINRAFDADRLPRPSQSRLTSDGV